MSDIAISPFPRASLDCNLSKWGSACVVKNCTSLERTVSCPSKAGEVPISRSMTSSHTKKCLHQQKNLATWSNESAGRDSKFFGVNISYCTFVTMLQARSNRTKRYTLNGWPKRELDGTRGCWKWTYAQKKKRTIRDIGEWSKISKNWLKNYKQQPFTRQWSSKDALVSIVLANCQLPVCV